MSSARIYVIRHCESTGNVSNRFMGHTNVEITKTGQAQLDCLAERFKGVQLDAIYASPLKRTVLTAQAVNRYHNLDIQIDDNLIEINFGDFDNLPFPEIVNLDPVNADYWSNRPDKFVSPHGESMLDVYERALPALKEIAINSMGKTVAAATHGCFIRNAVCRAMGLPLEDISQIPWCSNTGVALFEFDEQLNCNLIFKNDISHLPQEIKDQMHYIPKALRGEYDPENN